MRHRMLGIAIVAAAALTAGMPSVVGAQPLSPAAQRGLVFVRTNCAQCHAIGKTGASPLAIAPPFRTFHQKYPVASLEEALAEGIMTGHPSMPEFRLEPDQINAVISYLQTLER
jgi:cytochrome c